MEGFLLILATLLVVSIIQLFRSTRRGLWVGIGVLSSVLMFLFSGELPTPQRPTPTTTTAVAGGANPAPVAATPAAPSLPADQVAFAAVIDTARQAYEAAGNDLAKGGERPRRGKALCATLKSPKVKAWVGTVYRLSTNSDGRGVLSVELPGDIWLSTNVAAIFDGGQGTLIDPDSPLFATLSTLKEGQKVRVSGTLFKDASGVDCYDEISVLMDGTMSEPEFIFRFTEVQPVP